MEKNSNSRAAILLVALVLCLSLSNACYAVASTDNANWNLRQFESLGIPKDEFSFAVLGDTRDSEGRFEHLIEALKKDPVSFAVDIGDLVSHGRQEEFTSFFNQVASLEKPIFTVIGNHDLENGSKENYRKLIGAPYYSFQIAKSYFIMLDDSDEQAIDEMQLVWLKIELNRSKEYANRFVFMHVPLFDPRKRGRQSGHSLADIALAKKLNDIFDENKVTMLFVSHIHGYYMGIWGRTPYIISGGGGVKLSGSDPRHFFFHYIKVNVSDAGVNYEVIRM